MPKEFYVDDIYETTLGIINYLKNCTMQNFFSICDNDVKLFEENLNPYAMDFAYKFINSIQIG